MSSKCKSLFFLFSGEPSHCLLFSRDGHSHRMFPLREVESGRCGGMGHLIYFTLPVVSPTVVQVKKCALWYLLMNSSLLILYYMMIRF